MSYLSSDELARCLDVRDLTDPAAGPHALQSLVDAVLARLSDRPRLVRAHPVVTLHDNYEHLGYPVDAVTRDAQHTRYVDAGPLDRTLTDAEANVLRDRVYLALHEGGVVELTGATDE